MLLISGNDSGFIVVGRGTPKKPLNLIQELEGWLVTLLPGGAAVRIKPQDLWPGDGGIGAKTYWLEIGIWEWGRPGYKLIITLSILELMKRGSRLVAEEYNTLFRTSLAKRYQDYDDKRGRIQYE